MCGRYYIDDEDERAEMRRIIEEVNRRYKGTALCDRLKTGEIFPTDVVPVLAPAADAPAVRLMQWGMKLPKGGNVIINARSESAAEKPMFRQAVRQGRVLLPASAFYEWQQQADRRGKTRFCLTVPEAGFFYMAGLYRTEHLTPADALKLYGSEPGPETPLSIERFVIITMPASPWMSAIHDRMPLILGRDAAQGWLLDRNAALAMLAAPNASPLEALRMD